MKIVLETDDIVDLLNQDSLGDAAYHVHKAVLLQLNEQGWLPNLAFEIAQQVKDSGLGDVVIKLVRESFDRIVANPSSINFLVGKEVDKIVVELVQEYTNTIPETNK